MTKQNKFTTNHKEKNIASYNYSIPKDISNEGICNNYITLETFLNYAD